jgi:hypothetical protein
MSDPGTRSEGTLEAPTLPLLEQPLGALSFPFQDPLADDAPFTVAGLRVFVVGGAQRGIDEIRVHPICVATALRVAGAEVEAATASALGVERKLRVAGRAVVERLVVSEESPTCLLEWASDEAVDLEISWNVDLRRAGRPGESNAPLRWRAAERGLVMAADGDLEATFAFSEAPGLLRVEAPSTGAAGLRIRTVVTVPAGGSVRLATLGRVVGEDAARLLRAADRVAVAARARAGAAEAARSDGLVTETSDPGLDRTLARSQQRLRSYRVETPGVGRSVVAGYGPMADPDCVRYVTRDAVWTGLAALAAGDFELVREVLLFLGRQTGPDGRVPAWCATTGERSRDDDTSATFLYLLLVARYLAWSGDRETVTSEWERIDGAIEVGLAEEGGDPLRRVTLSAMEHVAEDLGAGGIAARLREAAGTADAEPGEVILDSAFWREIDVDALPGQGLPVHPDPAGCPDRALDMALPVSAFIYGVVGAFPDAPRGRLVLRPRPEPGWSSLAVRRLAVGEAAVTMEYRVEDRTHRFVVHQDRGGSPLQLVLEPELPGGRVAAATVDGVAADLEPVEAGDRWRVPVQIALDHTRTVMVELEAGSP